MQLDERRLEIEEIKKSIQEKNENIDAKITILAKNMKEIKGKTEANEKKIEEISLEKVEAKISEMTQKSEAKNLEKTVESFNLFEQRIKQLEDQSGLSNQNLIDYNKIFEGHNQEINAKLENLSKEIENISKSKNGTL